MKTLSALAFVLAACAAPPEDAGETGQELSLSFAVDRTAGADRRRHALRRRLRRDPRRRRPDDLARRDRPHARPRSQRDRHVDPAEPQPPARRLHQHHAALHLARTFGAWPSDFISRDVTSLAAADAGRVTYTTARGLYNTSTF
jgi:hypothetical protein